MAEGGDLRLSSQAIMAVKVCLLLKPSASSLATVIQIIVTLPVIVTLCMWGAPEGHWETSANAKFSFPPPVGAGHPSYIIPSFETALAGYLFPGIIPGGGFNLESLCNQTHVSERLLLLL